jgi:Mg-chelatase subunit ChlD
MGVEQATSGRASEPRRGWAGAVVETSSAAPTRQWEGGAAPGIDRHFRASRRRWRLRIASFFVLVLALTVAYLILLLHFPQRTPLVVAAAYQYDWPLAPNAWTREDLANLRRLDGQTVEMLDTSLAWKSRQHILADWDRTLAKIARHRSDTHSAVFYLSLHGVVSEDGIPYLVPPKSSPFDREQWVSVRELLERAISKLPRELNVLVILDCNRQLDNWNAGLVHNTFALRLSELVADLGAPNLAVLNSTSEGETAWSSSDIRGSVFGRAVLLGLAGAADRKRTAAAKTADWGDSSDSASDSLRDELGGDANGVVSAQELERYVAREVRRWSRMQRHSPQTPRLLSEKAADFTVAWTLHPTTLAKIEQELASLPAAADSITAEEIASLWSSFDALRDLKLERHDPVLWHDLEHQLMWLERLAASGEGYGETTKITHRSLRERLEKAVRAAAQVKARPTLAGRLAVLDERRIAWPRTLPVASFPLSENLGLFDAGQSEAIESALRASATGDSEPIPEGDNPPRDRVERLSEVHLQQLARAYRLRELWTDVGMAQEMTNERLRFERLISQLDFRALPFLQPFLLEADQRRRLAEDQFLAGETAAAADPASTLRTAYDQLAGQPTSPALVLERAWAVRDRSLSELPYWARWMAGQWRRAGAKTTPMNAANASRPTDPSDSEESSNNDSELPPAVGAKSVETSPPSDPAQIIELVVAAIALAEALDAATNAAANDSLREIATLAQQLEQRLDDLRRDYLARCSEMDKDPYPSGDVLRNLEDALELPFLPSEQRLNLRRALGRTARELHAKSADGNGATATTGNSPTRAASTAAPVAADSAGVTEAQRLANWRVHPLMSILWSEEERRAMEQGRTQTSLESKSELAAHLERTSHRLRLRLLEIAASSRGLGRGLSIPAEAKSSSDGTAVEEAVDSQDLLQRSPTRRIQLLERRTRLAAAVWLPPANDDAIQARRRFDLQRLLLWQAERSLDDCWGAGPSDPLIAAPKKPFFERAVADYLRACEMVGPIESSTAGELDQLRGKLARRSSALTNWASIRSRRDEATPSENQVNYLTTIAPQRGAPQRGESKAAVSRGDENDRTTNTLVPFPNGLATVALRTLDRRPVGIRAVTPVPLEDRDTVVMLAAPAVESGLEAVLIFRGNEVPEAVDDRLATGVVVDVRPVHSREARVTLFGDRRQRSSVVFILDCSGSMAREIAVEATGPSTLPRLELAKSALQSLLDQLAPRGEARVGVRFFGHRVGFSTEKPVKVLRQEAYPAPIPDDLHPGEDVELFLPLGRFDSVEASRVARRLESLQAWGQSPLYRALLQTRSDFDAEPEDTYKSVVVITDGENYQFAGNDPTLKAPQATTANDVRAAFGERKIPIYILGFGLSENEDQATEREFSELAKATQGEYFSVQNGRDLLKVLRTRLGVGTYSLRDNMTATSGASAESIDSPTAANPPSTNDPSRETRLNLPIVVPGLGDGVKPYEVRFESAQATLQLEGGESVALRTSPDGRDILAIPYEQGLPVSDSLSSTGHRERFTLRAHRPLLAGRVVRFRVSLQDEDLRFTARPVEVWIEIKPVIEEDTGDPQTYVFYDRYFSPNEPVPVIDCTANNWPTNARRAEVRAWCKLAPTPAAQQVSAAELLKEVERFAEPRTVSGVDGFQFRASIHEATAMTASVGDAASETGNGAAAMAWELRVVTQVADQGPDVSGLKVAWQADRTASPIRVVHRCEPTRRQAIHSFWFPVTTTREALARSAATLTFTPRQATRNGAFRTPNDRPLMVEVSGSDGTLQLDAATGPR